MWVKLTQIGAVAAIALAAFAPQMAVAGEADDAILSEINYAREYPQAYAMRLLMQPVSAWEQALGPAHATQDPGALAEAIDFLMRQTPLPPLQPNDDLAASALEHVADQGPRGAVGHDSPSGEHFDGRIRRHDVQAVIAAENIAYGPSQPGDVVRELIIDTGVPSRGHRTNIFHPALEAVGVSCGSHKVYAAMCVMDFAGGAMDDGSRQVAAAAPRAAPRQGSGGFLARLFGAL